VPLRNPQSPGSPRFRAQPRLRHALTFLIMLGFWVVFSGRFDLFHLLMGVAASALVSAWSAELLFPTPPDRRLPGCALRFAGYIPWLLYQALRASLHVLWPTFHPRMRELPDPRVIEFDSRLTGEMARVTFANSITLTPGTITVNVTVLGRFVVHCLDAPSARGLPGEMEENIARVFAE
jgi:multicomponent Na+:H+ antiporter subunit E